MEFEPGISEQDIECVIQAVVSMRAIRAFNLNSNFSPIPEFTVLAPVRRTLHTGHLIFWYALGCTREFSLTKASLTTFTPHTCTNWIRSLYTWFKWLLFFPGISSNAGTYICVSQNLSRSCYFPFIVHVLHKTSDRVCLPTNWKYEISVVVSVSVGKLDFNHTRIGRYYLYKYHPVIIIRIHCCD